MATQVIKSEKQKILDLLVKWGNNQKEMQKAVSKHYSYVNRVYKDSTPREKAKVIRYLRSAE